MEECDWVCISGKEAIRLHGDPWILVLGSKTAGSPPATPPMQVHAESNARGEHRSAEVVVDVHFPPPLEKMVKAWWPRSATDADHDRGGRSAATGL